MRISFRERRWPAASRSEPAQRSQTWNSRWTSTVTVWWWECNDIRTAGPKSALNPWTSNEQETTDTFGEASDRGARARHEGAGILRRILQRNAAVVRWRSLFLFVPHGRSGH